jgi:hypothetical protein
MTVDVVTAGVVTAGVGLKFCCFDTSDLGVIVVIRVGEFGTGVERFPIAPDELVKPVEGVPDI